MWIWLVGCSALVLDPREESAIVIYDLGAGVIPTPNDVARDAERAMLALPLEEHHSEAEIAFRTRLNRQDGWSTASAPAFEASAPLLPESVHEGTIEVWQWGDLPARVEGLSIALSDDGRKVEVLAPPTGWERGATYVVVVHGGEQGIQTLDGLPLGPDASFAYVRSAETLLGHDRAVPGATRAERAATLERLEAVRLSLAPYLEHAEARGLDRERIAALWRFTVTERPELAMDAASQRMPLPIDLLRDPATGLVSLPPSDEDDALVADAKRVLGGYNGFSLSAPMIFEITAPVDPLTVSGLTVELWRLGPTSERLDADVQAWSEDGPCEGDARDCTRVVVTPRVVPLSPGAFHALVVREGITDTQGLPLQAMAPGQLLALDVPVLQEGRSAISSVPDASAARIEPLRATLDGLLDRLAGPEREGIVTAWPFLTLDSRASLEETVALAETLSVDPEPTVTARLEPTTLLGDDGLGLLFPPPLNPAWVVYEYRLDGVDKVISGTLRSPQFLHPETRRWTEPAVEDDIRFIATIPAGVPKDEPVPVVIFGHALVTDRRWVMTIAGALAKKGFATISVDFPYHGERTYCLDATLIAIPNFLPPTLKNLTGLDDPLLQMQPCPSGSNASCSPTGQCLDANGNPEAFASLPFIDIKPAAGSAMLDVQDMPHVPDHFRQALVDLGALRRSLQQGDWETALGRRIRTDRFLYAGQSLGAIIGAVYVPLDPTIGRAVLNVPGANMVQLFRESTYFRPQMAEYLASREVEPGSFDELYLLNVAHWLVDPVDPHAVAHLWREQADRVEGLIQIDRVDQNSGDIVIPNATTDILQQASGLPMLEYPSILHGDLVIPIFGDGMLEDLADFLAEGN